MKRSSFDRSIAASIVLFIVLIFLSIVASVYIVWNYYDNQRSEKAYVESII